jgi:hypothetical protein
MTIAKNTDFDVKELSKWKKIEEAGTPLTLKRFIGDREVISKSELATKERLGVSAKTIQRNVAKGMPVHQCSTKQFQVFDWLDVIEWRDESVDKQKARATKKKDTEVEGDGSEDNSDIEETVNDIQGKIKQANEMLQLKKTSHDNADRIKKILDALVQAVKLGEQTKELIPKKDTEKVIVEFAAMLIAGYKRDIKILPKECSERKEEEIRDILESTYKSNIEKYQKMTKQYLPSENKLYDAIDIIMQLSLSGVSMDDIIKGLKNI